MIDYDYNKTMFSIYFTATIAICLGTFGFIISKSNNIYIIIGVAAALVSYFGTNKFHKRFFQEYLKLKKK